jgi:DNA-3-methyladenine glycosylase
MKKLPRAFYNRKPTQVAKDLLGKFLINKQHDKPLIGKIVEVEAYLGCRDLAAHSSKGLTKRTAPMFGPPGFAYVYLIYGIYHCINVVTEEEGCPTAVLVRAVEPIENIQAKTNGPGLLCKAMHIDKQLNNHDLLSKDFYIASDEENEKFKIIKRPRIGVDYAGDIWANKLLRFYIEGNPYVSKK